MTARARITGAFRLPQILLFFLPPHSIALASTSMFSLFRRISYGAIPRADRPWEDDPTSNAPTRRKRRMSSVERDAGDDNEQSSKRARGDTPATPSVANRDETPLEPQPQNDTEEVKEVTQGVHHVTLDTEASPEEAEVAPEAVPLPEENPGELEDLTTTNTVSTDADAAPAVDESTAEADDDASDVASSSGDVHSPPASPSKKLAEQAPETDKPSPDTNAVVDAPSVEEDEISD
ncbi:hypothetical protein D9619_009593 [Psilocybe cf. subviscida]|uniref:Uncharacterized protein n=1 Tax=Psilocybe cf. subviscida TaxID=2480587 RepID=A0A8H5BKN5_9AGAR|nr:hypothetical protein D9619_009593 [Psilocybe cf. subviscida]